VVFDRKNVSHFQLLQQGSGSAKYAVFDCLFANGRDLRTGRLSVRGKILKTAVEFGNVLLPSARLAEDGFEAYRVARRRGLEGVIAKNVSSPYIEGRSRYWLKVKIHHEEEFIIGGYTTPTGSRKYFGALLLGAYKQRGTALCRKGWHGIQREDSFVSVPQIPTAHEKKVPICAAASDEECDLLIPKVDRADFLHGVDQ